MPGETRVSLQGERDGVTSRIVPDRITLAGHPALRVGDGPGTLLVIPGLNDPLLRVTERWWYDAVMGRFMDEYADGRTVYFASRPLGIDDDATVADLADGYRDVLDVIGPATVLGLSLGGFIGLELAADDRVDAIVMGLAAHRLNPSGKRRVREWRDAAREERWRDIYLDAADVLGTGFNRRVYRSLAGMYAAVTGRPAGADDFVPTADACLAYDGTQTLEAVQAPTLVVGGTADQFFAGMDFATTARTVTDGTLVEIDGAGHEAVIESDEFEQAVSEFLDRERIEQQ